jgi:PQQ-like domain
MEARRERSGHGGAHELQQHATPSQPFGPTAIVRRRNGSVAALSPARFFHRLLPVTADQLVAVGGSNRKGHIRELELVSLSAGVPKAVTIAPAKSTSAAEVKAPSEPNGGRPWPQWRGPNRDGISTETGWRKDWPAEGPRKLWTAQVGAVMSSAVVADGRLFTQGNDGEGNDHIFALDAATGTEQSVAAEIKADLDAIGVKTPGPVQIPGGREIVPFDAVAEIAKAAVEMLPACAHLSPGARLGERPLATPRGGVFR